MRCSLFLFIAAMLFQANEVQSQEAPNLTGIWLKPCGPIGDPHDPEEFFDIVTMNFQSGSQWEVNILNFTDANCTTSYDVSPNPTAAGTYEIGDHITDINNNIVHQIDTHVTSFNGAPFDMHEYDIVMVEENTLYHGNSYGALDATSPARRPNTLNRQRVWHRQH